MAGEYQNSEGSNEMKAYGYLCENPDATKPSQLKEVTLSLSIREINLLIDYLQSVKGHFEGGRPSPKISHCHLTDWWKEWESSAPDIVIVYDAPPDNAVSTEDNIK